MLGNSYNRRHFKIRYSFLDIPPKPELTIGPSRLAVPSLIVTALTISYVVRVEVRHAVNGFLRFVRCYVRDAIFYKWAATLLV